MLLGAKEFRGERKLFDPETILESMTVWLPVQHLFCQRARWDLSSCVVASVWRSTHAGKEPSRGLPPLRPEEI